MSHAHSSDSIPFVIPVPKAPRQHKVLRSLDAVPWLPITIGATAVFMLAIVVMAVYIMQTADRHVIDARGVPAGHAVIRLDRAPDLARPIALARENAPREDLDALPLKAADLVDCTQIGTDVRFLKEPVDAFKRARAERKMVFMMHLSGNLDDKEFTWNNADAFRVNALADPRVAKYLNEHFVSTYMKVGAFKIVGRTKVGGNVASYFCLPDGSVVHAVAGTVNADRLRTEAMWAVDLRKSAQVFASNLINDKVDATKFASYLRKAHGERYHDTHREAFADRRTIPIAMPRVATPVAQTHWLLAKNPAGRLPTIYPVVWREILREELSDLPVERR